MRLRDRKGAELVVSPTHEEAVCDVAASTITSHRSLPLRLYQIDRKFRDEKRPRSGLIRAREFIMKDMYTFDRDLENARATYDAVCGAYDRLVFR